MSNCSKSSAKETEDTPIQKIREETKDLKCTECSHACSLLLLTPQYTYKSDQSFLGETVLKYCECVSCRKPMYVWIKKEWKGLLSIMADGSLCDTERVALLLRDDMDYQRLLILSQICYNKYDIEAEESPFMPYPRNEYAKLIWKYGTCVGFYTVKLQGQQKAMSVIDTVYIRNNHRRKGLGMFIVESAVEEFGGSGLGFGFSCPISDSLYAVLEKYLTTHSHSRSKIWECSDDGSEGCRQNVWLNIKLKSSSIKRIKLS